MADVEVRQTNGGRDGVNWLLVVVVLVLVLLIAWFLFAGGNETAPTEVEVDVPEAEAPTIEVPEEIDVNVRPGGEGGR